MSVGMEAPRATEAVTVMAQRIAQRMTTLRARLDSISERVEPPVPKANDLLATKDSVPGNVRAQLEQAERQVALCESAADRLEAML